MFKKNLNIIEMDKYSAWRKISLGSWRINGDSQVYCELKLSVEKVLPYLEDKNKSLDTQITLTHFLGRVTGKILKEFPELNVLVKFNRIFFRQEANVFFHVSYGKTDLSGCMIKEIDKKSLEEIRDELNLGAENIRSDQDQSFKQIKQFWNKVPNFLARPTLDLISFLTYGLNLNLEKFGVPKDAFGSMMITNIGSLGFDSAFVPLASYTKIPLIFALGKIKTEPVCLEDNSIVARKRVSVCITFDHRIIDGKLGAKVASALERYFNDPSLVD